MRLTKPFRNNNGLLSQNRAGANWECFKLKPSTTGGEPGRVVPSSISLLGAGLVVSIIQFMVIWKMKSPLTLESVFWFGLE